MRQKNSSYFTTFDKKKKKKRKSLAIIQKAQGTILTEKKKPFKENSPPRLFSNRYPEFVVGLFSEQELVCLTVVCV